MNKVDINCDMGESFGTYVIGTDESLMEYVTSANIACGYHAGDPLVIGRTVELAISKGVAIGAHPGFPDLMGFGRRPMNLTADEIESYIIYQVGAVEAFAVTNQRHLSHVKPHGSLYNMAAEQEDIANAIAKAVVRYNENLVLVGPPNSAMERASARFNLRYAREGFIDRAYRADGMLVSRSVPGSLLHDPEAATRQAIEIIVGGTVTAITGETIPMQVETLCIHGDSPSALGIAKAVRNGLEKAGCAVKPLEVR